MARDLDGPEGMFGELEARSRTDEPVGMELGEVISKMFEKLLKKVTTTYPAVQSRLSLVIKSERWLRNWPRSLLPSGPAESKS